MINFFYCLYFYFQAPTANKFIGLPNQYMTDYEYLKDHLKHKEKRTKDEEFLLNSIEELDVFREEIFNDERELWIDYWFSFDIENKINELLEEGLIDSVNQINNYTQWKNQD